MLKKLLEILNFEISSFSLFLSDFPRKNFLKLFLRNLLFLPFSLWFPAKYHRTDTSTHFLTTHNTQPSRRNWRTWKTLEGDGWIDPLSCCLTCMISTPLAAEIRRTSKDSCFEYIKRNQYLSVVFVSLAKVRKHLYSLLISNDLHWT